MWCRLPVDGRTRFPTEAICKSSKERRGLFAVAIRGPVVQGSSPKIRRLGMGEEEKAWPEPGHAFQTSILEPRLQISRVGWHGSTPAPPSARQIRTLRCCPYRALVRISGPKKQKVQHGNSDQRSRAIFLTDIIVKVRQNARITCSLGRTSVADVESRLVCTYSYSDDERG